jgi:signal transduction histidine kinase
MHKLVALIAGLGLFPLAATAAEERASTKDAELLVHNAMGFIKKEGVEKAFAAFSDPKGPFSYRDLYIVAYGLDGKCLAHGAKKERVGKSLINDKDPDGKLFVQERVKLAQEQGNFWQEYKFQNPATGKVEHKVAYCERAGDAVVCSGAYRP